jgi:hypothetical protein
MPDDPRPGDASARPSDDPASESDEGWEPVVGVGTSLEEVIERAFDYRGDVTVVRRDGTEMVGYLFNRNAEVPARFVQMFDRAGDGPYTIHYAEIRTIRFTGRDTAAGKSYEAWLRRKTEHPSATASDSARGA